MLSTGISRVALAGVLCVLPAAALAQSSLSGAWLTGAAPSIGVMVGDVTDATTAGALIDRVQEGSPAATAGFQPGDIVVEFDGERVRGARQFSRLVQETPQNRAVTVVVVRNGSRETLTVTPESRATALTPGDAIRPLPDGAFRLRPFTERDSPAPLLQWFRSPARLGASVTVVEGQLAEHYGVPGGVLVTSVESDSPASRAGLRAGDVITAAGSRGEVRNPSDLTAAVASARAGAELELQVRRGGEDITLRATLPQRDGAAPPSGRLRV